MLINFNVTISNGELIDLIQQARLSTEINTGINYDSMKVSELIEFLKTRSFNDAVDVIEKCEIINITE